MGSIDKGDIVDNSRLSLDEATIFALSTDSERIGYIRNPKILREVAGAIADVYDRVPYEALPHPSGETSEDASPQQQHQP